MSEEEEKAIECSINLCKETISWAEINPVILEKLYNEYKEQQKEIEDLYIKLDDKETEKQLLEDDIKADEKEIEELKEINKEHQLLNGALGFKIGTLESEIEEKTKLINSMKKFLLDTRLMSDYLESEGKI